MQTIQVPFGRERDKEERVATFGIGDGMVVERVNKLCYLEDMLTMDRGPDEA